MAFAAENCTTLDGEESESVIRGFHRYIRPNGAPQKKLTRPRKAGTQTPSPKKSGRPEISYDYQYAQYCVQRDFRMASASELCVHLWDGSCWQAMDQLSFETDAFNWLKQVSLKSASQSVAQRIAKSVPLELNSRKQYVPVRQTEVDVVPLKNAYLVIKPGSLQFEISKPDPALGMKFVINAELPLEALAEKIYTPQPVPEGSLFHQFLESSFPDMEVRALCQEMMASTILQRNFQKATILMGDGNNGKGVLHKIMAAVHERTIAKELDHLNDSHDLENIVGSSLILVDETPEGRIHVQRFKSLVSQDIVTINPKGLKAFSYTPQAKWIINGNHFMVSRDQSYGFWRRLVPIPMDTKITKKVLNLADLIVKQELMHVVDWLLEGAARIIQRGDLMSEEQWPKAVRNTIESAQLAANSVLSFIDDEELKIDTQGEVWTNKAVLFADYERYCMANGLKPFNSKNFFKGLIKYAEKQKTMYRERQATGAGGKRIRQISVSYQNASYAPVRSKAVDLELDDVPYGR